MNPRENNRIITRSLWLVWLREWGPVIGWIVVLCAVGIIGGTL
jgi:hypothetical protein